LLDSARNPHAAHGGSEVFSSNCYLRDFSDDVLVDTLSSNKMTSSPFYSRDGFMALSKRRNQPSQRPDRRHAHLPVGDESNPSPTPPGDSIQKTRLAPETQQLNDLVRIMEMHESRGKTYNPFSYPWAAQHSCVRVETSGLSQRNWVGRPILAAACLRAGFLDTKTKAA
jgi:hypothetical protein